jgi:hypothetical protein
MSKTALTAMAMLMTVAGIAIYLEHHIRPVPLEVQCRKVVALASKCDLVPPENLEDVLKQATLVCINKGFNDPTYIPTVYRTLDTMGCAP